MNITYILVFLLTLTIGYGDELEGKVGENIQLTCPHAPECGEIHSIKWYRDTERVYVYSPYSDFSNSENFLVGRSTVVEVEDSSHLEINDIQPTDDGTYRCEITYLEISEDCQAVFLHDLKTIALPSSVHMKVGEDVVLETFRDQLGHKSTVAGPYDLDSTIELSCEALEVKPEVNVFWYVGEEGLDATDESVESLDAGMMNIESKLSLQLVREHLGKPVSCSVEFQGETISSLTVELDVLGKYITIIFHLYDLILFFLMEICHLKWILITIKLLRFFSIQLTSTVSLVASFLYI
jgi:hypothetical protein